jgi:PhzF family phenazine biosynthesis protein
VVIQECGVGLVELRPTADRIAFAAPPLVRSGPVETDLVEELVEALGIGGGDVVDSQWVDNGPGWVALLLGSAEEVLAVQPRFIDMPVGVLAPRDEGIEVRAFFPKDGVMVEDPVTGSLNASLAQWLVGSGRLEAPYVASQGTALGRAGQVFVEIHDGQIWVGGATVTCVVGTVEI